MGTINSFIVEQSRVVVTGLALVALVTIAAVLAIISQFHAATTAVNSLAVLPADDGLSIYETADQTTPVIISETDTTPPTTSASSNVSSTVNITQSDGTAHVTVPNDAMVTVNGQSVAVPTNGSTQQTIPLNSNGGSLHVSVNSSNSGSTTGHSRTSLNIRSSNQ